MAAIVHDDRDWSGGADGKRQCARGDSKADCGGACDTHRPRLLFVQCQPEPACGQRSMREVCRENSAFAAPNGGEVYEPGNTVPILWTANGADWASGDTVTLEYSIDSGASWNPIPGAAGLAYNAGSYDWNTTGLPASSHYRVRVVFNGDTSINDRLKLRFHDSLRYHASRDNSYSACGHRQHDRSIRGMRDGHGQHGRRRGDAPLEQEWRRAFTSVPMTASGTPNQYCADIPGPSAIGDRYCYYIEATDSSTCAPNTARSPATGENCFNIIDCRPPAPTNPSPADGATGVSVDTDLSWAGGASLAATVRSCRGSSLRATEDGPWRTRPR